MTFALSTNWCNRRLETGEAIVDEALALGFSALELGFHTTPLQARGFARRVDELPVESVHAFCPVPVSAPGGHPELYSLADFDEGARALARAHLARTIAFAGEIGAATVVLHAGRVGLSRLFRPMDSQRLRALLRDASGDCAAPSYRKALAAAQRVRAARGAKLLEIFRGELERLVPLLQEKGVALALENLPYLEGFPNEAEMLSLARALKGAPVQAWFDTGHDRVRRCHGWCDDVLPQSRGEIVWAGLHVNDVIAYDDDHLAPGEGSVDFAALRPLAKAVRHRVLEPSSDVTPARLAAGFAALRQAWSS